MLKNKLNEIFTQINSFSNPLNVSIDQDFDKVNDLFLKMKQLIVLIKVDMMSQLGLIITYTDNDGD